LHGRQRQQIAGREKQKKLVELHSLVRKHLPKHLPAQKVALALAAIEVPNQARLNIPGRSGDKLPSLPMRSSL